MSAADDRYCANCRSLIPPRDSVCPACGVHAGDVFDGRLPRVRRRISVPAIAVAMAMIAAACGWWFLAPSPAAPPPQTSTSVRVVHDRPGGAPTARGARISEPEAVRLLRQSLTTSTAIPDDCIAVLGHGFTDGGYLFVASNRCTHTRLGRWIVDGHTGITHRE